MGQQASVPKLGTKIQVIGAGLSRTGTASFSRALEILLNGPVYHGGTQTTLGPEIEIKSWIKVLSIWLRIGNKNPSSPYSSPSDKNNNSKDKRLMLDLIADRLDGYTAITDAPGTGLIPELMELYPDAKVVCTVRDAKAWEKSMAGISNAATMWFLRFVLYLLPALRFFVDYINVLREAWIKLYGEREPVTSLTYERHIAWLEEIVPKDRLVFFDVKDGWEPLGKALGKEVPEGVPFPRINDGEAIDTYAKKHVQRGLIRWAMILAAVGTAIAAVVMQR